MAQRPDAIVRDFKGENRLLPDDLLPDSVSPDAQNCDYSRGTIRKRDGYSKLHPDPIVSGGVFIQNIASQRCVMIPANSAYNFTGTFTVELFLTLLEGTTSQTAFITYDGGSNFIYIRMLSANTLWGGLSTSTATNTATVSGIVTGKRYHVSFSRLANNTISLNVNGTVGTGSATAGTMSAVTPLLLGCQASGASGLPTNTTSSMIIDELRIWNTYRDETTLAPTRYRELNSTEIASTALVGYWRFNEPKGPFVTDESTNLNHGCFSIAGPAVVPGLLPDESGEGAALRFNGIDATASAAYTSQWATIMNTGTNFTAEGWVRLDNPNHASASTIFHLGSTASTGAGQQGPVFQLRFATTTNALQVLYATSTTATTTVTVGYTAVPGVPFHIAIVRTGTTNITVYINGVLYATSTTGLSASTGPTTSTTYGLYMGAQNNAGTFSVWAPVTIDEFRLWKSARSSQQLLDNMTRELSDATDDTSGNLVAYYRMNTTQLSGSIQIVDETGRFNASNAVTPLIGSSNTLFTPGSFNLRRAQGLVYPTTPEPFQLVATLVRRLSQNTNISIAPVFDREILAVTKSTMFSIAGSQVSPLLNVDFATNECIYNYCAFNEMLILTSGANANYKYDGTGIPHRLSLSQPAACSASPSGTDATASSDFATTAGIVQYKIAWRNSKDGTESLGSATTSVTIAATNHVSLTNIPTFTGFHSNVDQRLIYRTAPGGSVFYLLATLYDNTTTTYTDLGSLTLTAGTLYDANNGEAPVSRYCATHLSRVFVGNSAAEPSAIYWTEANSHYKFTATNVLKVTPGDGDEITGLCSAFGGLLIFKRYSIHFMSGTGNTSFAVRIISAGRGCVAAQTIAQSPYGVYFMSTDGVYRIDSGFAINPVSGFSTQSQSFSQQNLFRQINTKRLKFSTAVYDPIQHQYIVSFDCGQDVNTALPWNVGHTITDGSGTDISSYGTGIYAGAILGSDYAWTNDSTRGICLKLNGATAYVSAGTPLSKCGACFTAAIWFKVSDLASKNGIMSAYPTPTAIFYAYVNTNGSVGFDTNDATPTLDTLTTSAGLISVNTWYHLTIQWQYNKKTIFVNGQAVVQNTWSGPLNASTTAIAFIDLGTDFLLTNLMRGYIQYFSAAFDRPINISDIAYLYRSQLPNTDLIQQRVTLAYYEERDAWAKWDKGFDYLAGGSSRASQYILIGGKNGYVYQLKSGAADGAGREGSTVKLTGTLTSGGITTIVDSSASFPVSASGQGSLQGCYVTMGSPSQQRLIVDNTATTLYLDKTFAPTVTGAYTIAGIDWYWTSRYMDMGDSVNIKRWYWMQVWQKVFAEGNSVTFQHRTDQYGTYQSTTFTTAAALKRFLMNNRGRKLQIKFSNSQPNQAIDIEAFEVINSPHRFA